MDQDRNDKFQKLLGFFKALGNENRLKMVALLAEGDRTVRELAERLTLSEPTVSEHLAMLKDAGLVAVRPEGNFRIYSLNAGALVDLNHDLLSRNHLASLAVKGSDADTDLSPDGKILKNYFRGERLITIPATRKKLMVVLHFLADQFEFGRRYSEQEVNNVIRRYHEDYATLRRELIGTNLLNRERGIYWRPEPEQTS